MPLLHEPHQSSLVRITANEATPDQLHDIIERDGVVIVEGLISREAAARIRADLKPHFEADAGDASGFFPKTTRRAIGLLGKSDACVDLALNPLFNEVASRFLTSTYSYWLGTERHTSVSQPQISSTVGFQINPGSRQQALHRDEIDYHVYTTDQPMMMGCVTAIMKTTKEH